MADNGYIFDQQSARRIAAAVKAYEQRGSSPKNQKSGDGGSEWFWAKLTGEDSSNPGSYKWDKSDIATGVLGAGNPTHSETAYTATEINSLAGLSTGIYVIMRFAGYKSAGVPAYLFVCPRTGVPVKITSAGTSGQYAGKILTGNSTASTGSGFTAPAGMTLGPDAIICNLDESGLTGNRLKPNTFGLGEIVGLSSDGTQIVYIHGGVGATASPKNLPFGSSSPDATTWKRDDDAVPLTIQLSTGSWWDTSGLRWMYNYRTFTFDARGMVVEVSAETDAVIIGTTPCS